MRPLTEEIRALYRGRQGRVEFVYVPALTYLTVSGEGDPDSAALAAAAHLLQTVSHTARFVVKRRTDTAPRAMPLEVLWSVEDPAQVDLLAAVALGISDLGGGDRRTWRWQAMIMQPPGIDHAAFEQAVQLTRKKELDGLDDVRFESWEEGPAAQVLHTGPTAGEGAAIVAVHDAIEAAGLQRHGPHHAIYLRDRWRTAPERMRTLLRHAVAPK